MKDFYEILEVHPKASMEIIKKAYYTLVKKYHPDTTSFDKRTAEIKMIELNEAYSVLSNPEKRSEYDKKLFSSNTTNSNNDSNSNKQAHSQSNNSYDDSLENTPAGRFIFNAGKEILDVLNTQIIRKNGNEFNNRKICDNLNEKIENHLITATNVISDSSGYKKNIYYMLGLVYWQMAVAYTWTDSRHEPIKYIDLANKYISNDMDYYTNYQKTRNAIVQNEKILQQNEEAERKRKKVAFIKLAIIILLILGGCIYENSTASNNKSTSQSKSPVQTQQIKQPQAPKNINEKPIAKNGVITGYDPMQLILNDDGLSSLTIDNTNNDMPVYVRIWSLDSGEPVRAFYIRQGDMFTADSLTAGTYEVRYKELYENDVKSKASKSEPIVLEEYTIGRTTHYSNMSLTLYKVRNGNTTTTGIDEDDV